MGHKADHAISSLPALRGFTAEVYAACFAISASVATRKAYWNDARHWLEFCRARHVNPAKPQTIAIVAWVESMKADTTPKTRVRRLAALSSIYRRLRKDRKIDLDVNPFSVADGPDRERALAARPTPLASPDAVRAVLGTCDGSLEGVRDQAIIRILWATGARRGSLLGMTFERLQRAGDAFDAQLVGKGNKIVRVLIRGRAAQALDGWIQMLVTSGFSKGPLWIDKSSRAMGPRQIGRMLERRSALAGLVEHVTPHTFRVAFLTLNPASLDAKQDAAGHADPATTRLYDRSWRGREAFEAMPEIEEA